MSEFKVTSNKGGEVHVSVIDETKFLTKWDVPKDFPATGTLLKDAVGYLGLFVLYCEEGNTNMSIDVLGATLGVTVDIIKKHEPYTGLTVEEL